MLRFRVPRRAYAGLLIISGALVINFANIYIFHFGSVDANKPTTRRSTGIPGNATFLLSQNSSHASSISKAAPFRLHADALAGTQTGNASNKAGNAVSSQSLGIVGGKGAQNSDVGTVLLQSRSTVTGVLYNRVDKSGGSSFVEMIRLASEMHKFQVWETNQFITTREDASLPIPSTIDKKVIREIQDRFGTGKPFVLHGHYPLIDLPWFAAHLAHINLVRDPVKRIVSRWNYLAFGHRPDPNSNREALALRQRLGVQSLHDFVRHPDRERLAQQLDIFPMRLYFCTSEQRKNCTAAAATHNLGKFDAVAVLEMLDESLAVIDYRLPSFFGRAKQMMPANKVRELGDCPSCEKPDDETLRLLREMFREDDEFYQSCVIKLKREFASLPAQSSNAAKQEVEDKALMVAGGAGSEVVGVRSAEPAPLDLKNSKGAVSTASKKWSVPRNVVAVMYNRVDKCGSSSLVEMIRTASRVHQFKVQETKQYITFRTDRARRFPKAEEVNWRVSGEVRETLQGKQRFVFHGHYNLMDLDTFSPHGFSDMVFINMIRDPLKRVISRWNYLAYGPRPDPRTKAEAIELRKRKGAATLSEFARHPNRKQIQYELDMFPMRHYFCKSSERGECTVSRAVANLDQFAVVAVLEMLNQSLAVLDHALPTFFGNAKKLMPQKRFKENENCKACEKPDEATTALLKELYSDDYEFYAACVTRLGQDFAELPAQAREAAHKDWSVSWRATGKGR